MFEFFFFLNNLIYHKKSSFKPSDSCINHVLLIIHEIYKSFGDGLGICGVFVDISKAFDKVLHKGLV